MIYYQLEIPSTVMLKQNVMSGLSEVLLKATPGRTSLYCMTQQPVHGTFSIFTLLAFLNLGFL